IEARVLVTQRMKPVQAGGHTVHQIGLPYHWGVGKEALITGDGANDLLGLTLDPNVFIPSAKAVACDIQRGRRPRGEALLDFVSGSRGRAGITARTGETRLTYERAPETMKVDRPLELAAREFNEGDTLECFQRESKPAHRCVRERD